MLYTLTNFCIMNTNSNQLLELFYAKHSHMGNLDTIFVDNIKSVIKNYGWRITNVNYSWVTITNTHDESFDIPWMVEGGYFNINNVDKVPLIQEIKSRYTMFTSFKNGYALVQTRFVGSPFPIRLYLNSSEIYLDVSAFGNQLQESIEEKEVTMFGGDLNKKKVVMKVTLDKFLQLFGVNLQEVIMDMEDDTTVTMTIMSSLRAHEGNMVETTKETLKEFLFTVNYLADDTLVDNIAVNTVMQMVKEAVYLYFGKKLPTDRDNLSNKMFRPSGILIGNLLNKILSKAERFRCAGQILNYNKVVDDTILSMMRTGNMVISGKNYPKMVIRVSHRSTFDTMSSVRKIVIPCDENSAGREMRQVHSSQFGFICLSETPEGKSTGLVKHLAFTSVISPVLKEESILQLLIPFLCQPYQMDNMDKMCNNTTEENSTLVTVLFDGMCLGRVHLDQCLKIRNKLKIKFVYISIVCTNTYLEIRTWVGRLMRPLLVKDRLSRLDSCLSKYSNLDLVGKWDKLVNIGIIEYLDSSEVTSSDIETTHVELHPVAVLGTSASLIPFANHNQTARNIFASSMVKQAMQLEPIPSAAHEGKYLISAQKPLVNTIGGNLLGMNEKPNGVNLLVVVMSYTGYNMEDAIIVNKGAADRGLFSSRVRKSKLDESDELESYPRLVNNIGREGDNYRFLSVGDKLASRHAQKGVIGRLLKEEDMPFTEDGTKPDIIFNAHGIPSRMTMGQLLEGIIGVRCIMEGTFFDGTAFTNNISIDNILEMENKNSTWMYNGMTGELIDKVHCISSIYYMPLTHQSADKVYVRWIGPKEVFSRQPVSGKKHGGGLKLGEMEVDAVISHGASNILLDTIRQSDMSSIPVCNKCGEFPISDRKCYKCKSKEIAIRDMPYSLKVFSDFTKCANIGISFEENSSSK